jgi:hypothetical protein
MRHSIDGLPPELLNSIERNGTVVPKRNSLSGDIYQNKWQRYTLYEEAIQPSSSVIVSEQPAAIGEVSN